MSLRKVAVLGGALSLFVSQMAMAVGLGEIKLNSSLNEPLDAEIELLNVGELSDLEMLVGLASRKDFERAGVPREFFLSDLQFTVDLSGSRKIIRVKSRKPVREPYLDFLVELQWPAGRLLREYTMLVDLPVFVSEEGAAKKPQAKTVQAASTAKAASSSQSSARPSRASSSRQSFSTGGEYRVQDGDSLWAIARRHRPEGASIPQTITAIHEMNPNAFINGDVNLLKRGEVLRLPDRQQAGSVTSSEVRAILEEGDRQSAKVQEEGPLLDAASSVDEVAAADDKPEGQLKLAVADSEVPESESGKAAVSSALESNADITGAGAPAKEALENDLAIAYEELERKSRELEELKARNRMLEEQVETQQRIVEIQDSDLRAAQLSAAQDLEASSEPAAEVSPAVESDNAASTATAVEPEPSQSFWQKYFYYLIGLGGVIVALVLVLLGRSRKQDAHQEPEFDFDDQLEPVMAAPASFGGGSAQETAAALHEVELEEDDELFAPAASNDYAEESSYSSVEPSAAEVEDESVERGDELLIEDADHLPSIDDDVFAGTNTSDAEVDQVSAASQEEAVSEDFAAMFDEQQDPAQPLVNEDDAVAAEESVMAASESTSTLDFDLDLDLDEIDLDDLSDGDTAVDTGNDLPGDFTLDLGEEPSAGGLGGQPSEGALSGQVADEASDLPDDEFDLLADADEVSTKLDLAKAYVDMGDAQGARDILEEVISEGSEEQQETARQLLEGLS